MQSNPLFAGFEAAETGAEPAALAAAAAALGVRFPDDYAAFMLQHNGGEGFVGAEQAHLVLWRIEELAAKNKRAGQWPGFVFIGGDAAGERVAFRAASAGLEVVLVPCIGSPADALVGGKTLFEFVDSYGSGKIWAGRRG